MRAPLTLAALFASGALVLAGAATPAAATSMMTEAFLANVRPNIDFLDKSSRLALDNSRNGAIRDFAHSEAREQTITANALVAYTQTNTVAGAEAAIGPDVLAIAPAGTATVDVPDLTTGRSVAIDVPEPPLTVTRAAPPPPAGSALLPAGQADLDRLSRLNGRAFDRLYKSTNYDALRQLATLYASYIQNGDDPSLRAMAARELPKINLRMTELRKL